MSEHEIAMYMVACDHRHENKKCLALFDQEGDVVAWESVGSARLVANESGWNCGPDGDFCPIHDPRFMEASDE